jgi:hypothetical protein
MRRTPDQADRPSRHGTQASMSIAKYNDARRTLIASSFVFVAKKMLIVFCKVRVPSIANVRVIAMKKICKKAGDKKILTPM